MYELDDYGKSPCNKCNDRQNKDQCPYPCSRYQSYSVDSYRVYSSDLSMIRRNRSSKNERKGK